MEDATTAADEVDGTKTGVVCTLATELETGATGAMLVVAIAVVVGTTLVVGAAEVADTTSTMEEVEEVVGATYTEEDDDGVVGTGAWVEEVVNWSKTPPVLPGLGTTIED